MTTTPNFDDLTPPDELMREWSAFTTRWGARHGWEQARQLWPEPIDGKVQPPTEKDGDAAGRVQVLIDTGGPLPSYWSACNWRMVGDRPWLHTASWQPRQPSLQEQAQEILKRGDVLEQPLTERDWKLICRALEQAGEGVE